MAQTNSDAPLGRKGVEDLISSNHSPCQGDKIDCKQVDNDSPCKGVLTSFREKYLDQIIECARSSIHLKSPRMEPVYQAIEKYVSMNELTISNEPTDTTRKYCIFGARIFFHAENLANTIADIIPYVRMNTIVREKEFDIQVDGARIIRLFNIDPTFAKIITPCPEAENPLCPKCIPAEVELVDVYHRLYSPDSYKSRPMIRKYESDLWNSFLENRDKIILCDKTFVTRGSNNHHRNKSKNHASNASGGMNETHSEIVISWLKTMREYAIVGNFALTCMNAKTCPSTGAMQIIVGNVKQAITSLTAELIKYIPKAVIESRKYDIQLPTDYRIKKYVISASILGKTYYIANLFNCASYELIPIVSIGGLKIASQDVILRFLFIELWFIRVVYGFGKITNHEYNKVVNIIFTNTDSVHASWLSAGPPLAPPNYIGTYINENVSKKTEEMIPPYFPAQYKRDYGVYRSHKPLAQ